MSFKRASYVMIGGRFVGRLFDVALTIILARLLTPEDFGLVSFAMIFVTVAEGVSELPVGQVLLREPRVTRAMFSTAFTLSLVRSVCLLVGLGLCGVATSMLSGDPRFAALMAALSIAPAVRGLLSPRMTVYSRTMDFRRDVAAEIAGKAAALAVAAALAFETQSYWAIAAATITSPVVQVGLSYALAPFRPSLTLQEWNRFSHFVKWGSATQILNVANWQAGRFMLGVFGSAEAVGRYALASDLCALPHKVMTEPLGRPMYTRYTQDALAGRELPSTYLRYSAAILTIIGPVYVGLAVLSDRFVPLLLGDKWLGTSHILSILAVYALAGQCVYPLGSWALAIGKAPVLTWRAAAEFLLVLPLQAVGVAVAGIEGLLAAQAVGVAFMLAVNMYTADRFGCPFGAQLRAVSRPFVALAAMAVTLFGLRSLLDGGEVLVDFVLLAAAALAGGLVYCLVLFGLWSLQDKPDGVERLLVEQIGRPSLFGRSGA